MIQNITELDATDELRSFKNHFEHNGEVYLNGNSLGKLPLEAKKVMQEVVAEEWGRGLITSWYSMWLARPAKIAAKIAQLVGASPEEIFIGDSTSINLYKLLFAALKEQEGRTKVIIDDINFPTDYYVLHGLLEEVFKNHQCKTIHSPEGVYGNEDALISAISKQSALVFLSHVAYKSAFMYDMAKINERAREKGALTLWDLSHSVGAVPIDLSASKADLAVGCLYKYMNGGPGAPAFIYVRKDLQAKLTNPIKGWFGHQNGFVFSPDFIPSESIQKFGVGTPGILSLSAIEPGIDLMLEAGTSRLRAKSILLSEYFISQFFARLEPLGYELVSPKEAQKRGSHISISHKHSESIYKELIKPEDLETRPVICDFRPPSLLRMGIAPIYNSFADIEYCVMRLEEIVKGGG